jgi:asparagine synthase (glutamine-hydrolysing)
MGTCLYTTYIAGLPMNRGQISEYAQKVLGALELATAEDVGNGDIAVAFSGGLDSTIISTLLANHSRPKLYTVGIEDSFDLAIGEKTAQMLGLTWEGIVVEEQDLIDAIFEIVKVIPTTNPVTISFEMPLFLVASRIKECHIYSGQGADELFAGYAKYVVMSDEEREQTIHDDLVRLLEQGLIYEKNLVNHHDKELHCPYVNPMVLEVVRSIPLTEEFRGSERKAVLRDVARLLDMGEIADRKKKAAQYGSGIMKTLRHAAKRNGMTVRAFIRALAREGEMP